MSTKIYNGIRVKQSDLQRFIKLFRKKCLSHIEFRVRDLMAALNDDLIVKSAELRVGLRNGKSAKEALKDNSFVQKIRFYEAIKIMLSAMRKNEMMLNPDSWFNAFPSGEYIYIIPGYPTGMKSIKWPKWVEEFGYWNNTDDTPPGVSYKEFRKRDKVWEKAGAYDIPHTNRLCYELITKTYTEGLWGIEKKIFDKFHSLVCSAEIALDQEQREKDA